MKKKAIDHYLSQQALFAGLDEKYIAFLSRHAKKLSIEKGEMLFRQGEPAEKFYVVRDGRISVQIPSLYGPPLEIQALGNDQVLGWSWLIAPYRWSFQAKAELDTDLLEFDGRAVLAHCEEEPRFGFELLKRFAALMSERLEAARLKMMEAWNPPGLA